MLFALLVLLLAGAFVDRFFLALSPSCTSFLECARSWLQDNHLLLVHSLVVKNSKFVFARDRLKCLHTNPSDDSAYYVHSRRYYHYIKL